MQGSKPCKRKCVADLEGDGLLDSVTKIHCGVFIDVKTNEVFKFRPHEIKQMLAFMDTCETLIFHNGYGYDFPALEKVYGYKYKGNKVDTLVMSRLLFPNRKKPEGVETGPHSVESWGVTFGRHKPENEDWSVFTEHMLHRCVEDTQIQLLLYKKCIKKANKQGWPMDALRISFKLFEILGKQEQNGWPVDTHKLNKNLRVLERWVKRIDTVLAKYLPNVLEVPYNTPVKKPFRADRSLSVITQRWFTDPKDQMNVAGPFTRVQFRKVNLSSNQELKDFLLARGWKPKEWNYKKDPVTKFPVKDDKGNLVRSSPKLSYNDPFVGIESKIGRLAAKRVQALQRYSILKGWRENLRPDGTLQQRITGIASTGRLTHSGIVNVPGGDSFFGKQMRKIFYAPLGYVVVGTDSAGCQNRMLAARVNDPAFTEILINGDKKKGTSIHQVNQRAIKEVAGFDVTYHESKTLNYAFMFGAMDKKLGSILGKGPEAGAKIREALLSVSPGFQRLVDRLVEEWRSTADVRMNRWNKAEYFNGTVTGLDGRPILIENEKDILVYMLQSDEAIMMQYALCFLYKWLQKRGFVYGEDYFFTANVHDEYQACVKEHLAEQYAELANRSISYAAEYLKIKCPHKGESDIGRNWHETH